MMENKKCKILESALNFIHYIMNADSDEVRKDVVKVYAKDPHERTKSGINILWKGIFAGVILSIVAVIIFIILWKVV